MSNPWDNIEAQRWVRHIRSDLVPKLEGSGAVVSIVPSDGGEGDVKFWVELGASIMLDKPIVVVVAKGQPVPAKLRLVADEVVEIQSWDEVSADEGPIREAIMRVLPDDRE